jgi:hypothetical protein
MTLDPTRLLQMLEPAVRPSYAPVAERAGGPRAALEARPFDELLEEAKAGLVRSGRPVRLAHQPAEAIGAEALRRLGEAADLAEAAGAQRALLVSEGRSLLLDVTSRTITGELTRGLRAARLDAAVFVPGPGDGASPRVLGPPSGVPPKGI